MPKKGFGVWGIFATITHVFEPGGGRSGRFRGWSVRELRQRGETRMFTYERHLVVVLVIAVVIVAAAVLAAVFGVPVPFLGNS